MAATPASSEPQSPEPRPLSEHEQRTLGELEARLVGEDPGLNSRLARTSRPWRSHLSSRAYNAIVQATVVLVIAIVVLPAPATMALLVLLTLMVTVGIASWSIRHDSRR